MLNHDHNWFVVSTEITHVCLLVVCDDCGSAGIVRKPSREEWAKAFDAPSNPYAWNEPGRVVMLSNVDGESVALLFGGFSCQATSAG